MTYLLLLLLSTLNSYNYGSNDLLDYCNQQQHKMPFIEQGCIYNSQKNFDLCFCQLHTISIYKGKWLVLMCSGFGCSNDVSFVGILLYIYLYWSSMYYYYPQSFDGAYKKYGTVWSNLLSGCIDIVASHPYTAALVTNLTFLSFLWIKTMCHGHHTSSSIHVYHTMKCKVWLHCTWITFACGLTNDCIHIKFLELNFLCKLIQVTALDHALCCLLGHNIHLSDVHTQYWYS